MKLFQIARTCRRTLGRERGFHQLQDLLDFYFVCRIEFADATRHAFTCGGVQFIRLQLRLHPTPRRQIVERVLHAFLHHLRHRCIVHVHGGFHFDDLLFARARIAREHMQDAVRINLELHSHSRNAAWRGFKFKRELSQAPVVLRAFAFALQHMDQH